MARRNYRKSDIFLDLVDALRSYDMTRAAIRDLLSDCYRRAGTFDRRGGANGVQDVKVSEKTVTRTLDAVRHRYGDRLDFDQENGTYHLYLDDFPDALRAQELQALDVAIQRSGTDMRTHTLLVALKTKLTTKFYRNIKRMDPKHGARAAANIQQKIDSDFAFIGPHAKINIDPDIKERLDLAIMHQHKIIMNYRGREHTICPLGIMYGPHNVYLIATPVKPGTTYTGPRNYILTEISNFSDTNEWFERDNAFTIETYANSMFGIYHDRNVYDIDRKSVV